MGTRSPYGSKVDVIYHEGAQHIVYLDKSSGVFTAIIEKKLIRDTNLPALKKRVREALETASELVWKPVIVLSDVKENELDDDPSDNDQEAVLALNFHRQFMATDSKGTRYTREFIPKEGHDGEIGDPAYSSYNKRADILIPYTPQRWRALLEIREQLVTLRSTFNAFLLSDKAEQLLDAGGKNLLESGKEKSDG